MDNKTICFRLNVCLVNCRSRRLLGKHWRLTINEMKWNVSAPENGKNRTSPCRLDSVGLTSIFRISPTFYCSIILLTWKRFHISDDFGSLMRSQRKQSGGFRLQCQLFHYGYRFMSSRCDDDGSDRIQKWANSFFSVASQRNEQPFQRPQTSSSITVGALKFTPFQHTHPPSVSQTIMKFKHKLAVHQQWWQYGIPERTAEWATIAHLRTHILMGIITKSQNTTCHCLSTLWWLEIIHYFDPNNVKSDNAIVAYWLSPTLLANCFAATFDNLLFRFQLDELWRNCRKTYSSRNMNVSCFHFFQNQKSQFAFKIGKCFVEFWVR